MGEYAANWALETAREPSSTPYTPRYSFPFSAVYQLANVCRFCRSLREDDSLYAFHGVSGPNRAPTSAIPSPQAPAWVWRGPYMRVGTQVMWDL